jgi:WG containing repeat
MRTRCIFSLLVICFFIAPPVEAQDLLIAAKKDSKWGYINTSGVFIIPARFDEAFPFYKGLAVVKEKDVYGVIDVKGKWALSGRKGQMNPEINSNRITLTDDLGKWGAVDVKGKTQVPFEYDAISHFQNGWVVAGKKTTTADLLRMIVLDTLGQAVISFDNIYLPQKSFETKQKVKEGYTSVLVDGDFKNQLNPSEYTLSGRALYFALLDIRNKKLINAKINSLQSEVKEGRLNLTLDGISYSWSVPLASELSMSEAKFSYLSPAIYSFSGGIAAVQKNGKWAYIDKDGSLLSETNLPVEEYKSNNPVYFGGFVIFKKSNGTEIFTDLNGNQKIGLEFDVLTPFQYGFSVAKHKGKYGLLQKDGSWAAQPEFDDMRF